VPEGRHQLLERRSIHVLEVLVHQFLQLLIHQVHLMLTPLLLLITAAGFAQLFSP
jgi:hypothetical protein